MQEEYPISPIAQQICEKRYFKKDANGKCIENWDQLVERVVTFVCKNENKDFVDKCYNIIKNRKFLPNSPCLVNAGNSVGGLLACFVTQPPSDCWHDPDGVGMIENIANFGHVARRGGGCGVSFSNIRPEGDPVFGSTHAKACGPIEHMRMISEVMSSITQAGFRGMAMMGTLDVSHPDIMNFIVCKQRDRALKTLLKEDIWGHYEQMKDNTHEQVNILLDKFIYNFNISIVVNNKFMKAVEKDQTWELVFNNKVYKIVKAREIFNMIAENAWKNGDPGMLFYEAMNSGPYKYSKQIINATNPCGEQVLPAWGSCNLGSIDVSKFYHNGNIDWNSLKETIETAIQFLDNVIDVNRYPTIQFETWAKENRPVGLGIMGLADLLLKMELAYGSVESLEFCKKLAKFYQEVAHKKSVELGKLKGTPKSCQFKELEYRRNVTTVSIAPTGTISLLAGCSSSIEPIYAPSIRRYDNTGSYEMPHPCADKPYFRSAINDDKSKEVKWQEHVAIQATFQAYCDSAISKTINLPKNATVEDVKNVYMTAWKSGCKGITIYRDGSKTTQVLNSREKGSIRLGTNHAVKRPTKVPADIYKRTADGFQWHIIIGLVDNCPYEVFAVNGSTDLPDKGYVVKRKSRHYSLLDINEKVLIDNIAEVEHDIDPKISLETRRFSLELRHGIPLKYIVQQIDKSTAIVNSFAKVVNRVLKTNYLDKEELNVVSEPCPECAKKGKHVQLVSHSGCLECPVKDCGYSKCS